MVGIVKTGEDVRAEIAQAIRGFLGDRTPALSQ
jgi:hypothetical protein